MEEMVQVLLGRKDGACIVNVLCYLPVDNRVGIGKKVTVEMGEQAKQSWTVLDMYAPVKRADIKQIWRVGGLV